MIFPVNLPLTKTLDASKVPPSRFQKREGSIYATAGSRDGHTGRVRDRDQSFHEKLKTKVSYNIALRNGSPWPMADH